MSITEKNTQEIRSTLSSLIGKVTAKALFAGYGIYQHNDMFGVYQSGIFYLRAKDKLALFLENNGAVRWVSPDNVNKLTITHYYQLPNAITQNSVVYKQVILESIQQIKEEKLLKNLKEFNRIKQLPNLTIKYERLLAKVDIKDVSELKVVGAVNAYVRLKKNGCLINLSFFWNLFAALQNKNAKLLTETEKIAGLKTLNVALAHAGLRQIKCHKEENELLH